MYVDPELVDFNLKIMNIDGVDHLVNYAPYWKKYRIEGYFTDSRTTPWNFDYEPGIVNSKAFTADNPTRTMEGGSDANNYFRMINLSNKINDVSSDQFTIAGWMKFDKVTKIALSNYGSIWLWVKTGTKVCRYRILPNGSTTDKTLSYTFYYNDWIHYALVYHSGAFHLYLNGTNVYTKSTSIRQTYWGGFNLMIQSNRTDTSNNSSIISFDDVIAVRQALWTENFDPPTEPLLEGLPDIQVSPKVNRGLLLYPSYPDDPADILKVY